MTFTNGMPESGSSLGNTRQKFVDNFTTLRTAIQANHGNINDATNTGKHRFCQFSSVASGTTSASELAFFNKAIGGSQRFFIQYPSSGSQIQLTGPEPTINATDGFTFLPGGLLIQWGNQAVTTADTPVTFPTAFSAIPFSITLTAIRAHTSDDLGLYVKDASPATTGFSIVNNSSSVKQVYWMAIGSKT